MGKMGEKGFPEPGSFGNRLGIDKPTDWMHDMVNKCYEMFMENPEDFYGLLSDILGDKTVLFVLTGLDRDVIYVSKTFFVLGFMKGICFSETSTRLDNLVKKKE